MCSLWPGLTPFNVWDLPWRHWVMFAAAADSWVEARKEAARGQ